MFCSENFNNNVDVIVKNTYNIPNSGDASVNDTSVIISKNNYNYHNFNIACINVICIHISSSCSIVSIVSIITITMAFFIGLVF